VDGANLRKVWEAPGTIQDFSYSPDRRELAVTAGGGLDPHPRRIWEITSDGGGAHLLLPDWPKDAYLAFGQWTPDGRHFVFLSNRDKQDDMYELAQPRWFEFWKKPWAVRITGNQVSIVAAAAARDSKGLFVMGRLDQGEMQAYDPHSEKMVPFLDHFSALEFVVSPDRQWMAYSAYPDGRLWKSRLDGSEPLQLTSGRAYMQQWSPDGKWIAYMDWHTISVVSVEGGTPETLIHLIWATMRLRRTGRRMEGRSTSIFTRLRTSLCLVFACLI
jgi:dipeptidyl aminopeptidase/acylaminoacyl peptidase